MDDLWTVRRYCIWKYNLPDGTEPKKSQVNTVSKLCRDGKLPAMKLCGEWRIDVSEIMKEVRHAKKKSGAR